MADPSEISPGYIGNNAPRLVSYALFIGFNVAFFAYAVSKYSDREPLVQIARGCGGLMNFNAAFLLLPMMRLFISWIRRTRLVRFMALEDSIGFHRLSGHVMFAAAVVHTGAYVALYWPDLGANLTGSRAAITGCVLVGIFLVLWILALERSRRKWRYEVFLTAHALGIPLALVLLVHSPNYWKWFTIGGSAYLADRAVRFWRMRRPSTITSARHLPSQVTELVIARPEGWTYRPGDFVWLLVPTVAHLEWHPFTISSSPERADTFTVHVRTVGDWTTRLYDRAPKLTDTRVFFDGPHGAPANDIFDSKVAVLVGAGIGVTPFASILQSLLARGERGELHRIYFYWINRDHHAFEWFTEMLGALKQADATDMFEIHLFVTAAPSTDAQFTKHGRPDWSTELARIHAAHGIDDVALFYCGPRALARTLHAHCRKIGWRFKEEHF